VERFDAVVVGAGAAGSVAALKLARSGLVTLLVEQARGVGKGSPGKIDITQDTGIKGIMRELRLQHAWKSNKSLWFSRNECFRLESRIGDLFVRRGDIRDSFEADVAGKAEDAGCEIALSCASSLSPERAGGTHSLRVRANGKAETLKADYIVCADGSNSRIAAQCFPGPNGGKGILFVGFGVLTAGGLGLPDPRATHIFLDSELAPGGYFYMAENERGGGVAAIVVDAELTPNDALWHFKQFMKRNPIARKRMHSLRRCRSFSGECVAGKMPSWHKGNVLFTGDAGLMLDPLLGYGLNHAILSGYYAAEAIATKGPEGHCATGNEYNSRISQEIRPELQDGRLAKKAFNYLDTHDLDRLVGLINDVSASADLDEFLDNPAGHVKHVLQALAKKPGYLLLLRHLGRML
jgi:electron transfer flavoprotein-quinone oxidoreductase